MKKQIGLVFGGKSDEYDVSLHSAANVYRALNKDKYDIIKIGITDDGRWFVTEATPEQMESNEWIKLDNKKCVVPHDPTVGGILAFDAKGRASVVEIGCFVPILHGDHGEDGQVQALFELCEIPYVGSGVEASANCMDKACTKQIAKLTGVTMARDYIFRDYAYRKNPKAVIDKIYEAHQPAVEAGERESIFPLFVKPSSAGSSVGVSKVNRAEELPLAIEEALKCDRKVIVEEAIVGREMEVAVLGNENPVASSIGEILSAGDFYSYEAKYSNPDSMTRVAIDLPDEKVQEFKKTACELYRKLDCSGLARVDFFYRAYDPANPSNGEIIFNEINTLPGFTNISMYPMLWRHDGVPTDELMDKLIELAMEK